MFKYIYLLIATILYIVAIPYLIFLSLKEKYKNSIPARFFLSNNNSFETEKVWFHTCSLGETKAIKPLAKGLQNDINISVITNTGYTEAKEITNNVKFLPFEIFLPFWIKKQKALVVVEAELWYMLFVVAKNYRIPTILINARISDKSYPKYKKFTFFYKKIFANIDFVYAQSNIDKDRLISLGAKNVEVIGNIKISTNIIPSKSYTKPKNCTIITAGSTHNKEEEAIIDSFLSLNPHNKQKLIIAPRHPERFAFVDELISQKIKGSNLLYHKFAHSPHFDSDIILLDTIGELVNIYAISDVVLLCGSFVDNIGGHNPIEVASFGAKIISGEYFFNQKPLYEMVEGIQITNINNLSTYLSNIADIPNSKIIQKTDITPLITKLKELNK